jgi:hypothetical protein
MRKGKPVTIPPELVEEVWREVKAARDEAMNIARTMQERDERFTALLTKMRGAGMSDHLPTIEEVRAAWRGESVTQG